MAKEGSGEKAARALFVNRYTKPKTQEVPKTGDSVSVHLLICLCSGALLALTAEWAKRRR